MSKKEWLIAAILTLITISAWVIFDIIHARSEVQIPTQLQQAIEPISPDFNIKSLQQPTP